MLDLLYNLMLESTGRLQKCRIYEMTDNKTARSTIAYLIVRDQAHENAYAKALETLGRQLGKALPIPKTNAERFPEVKKLLDQGLHLKQYTFSADNLSEAGKIYRGTAPATTNGVWALRATATRCCAAYGVKDSIRDVLPAELTEPFLDLIDRLIRELNRSRG